MEAMQAFSLDRHAEMQLQELPHEKRDGAKAEVPQQTVGRYGAAQSGGEAKLTAEIDSSAGVNTVLRAVACQRPIRRGLMRKC